MCLSFLVFFNNKDNVSDGRLRHGFVPFCPFFRGLKLPRSWPFYKSRGVEFLEIMDQISSLELFLKFWQYWNFNLIIILGSHNSNYRLICLKLLGLNTKLLYLIARRLHGIFKMLCRE